jgi:hypothetical protein
MHPLIRGYGVLVLGMLVFFVRRLLAGDPLLPDEPMAAQILSDVELWIVICTAFLIGPIVAFGRPRAMLIAAPFAIPPVLLYLTFYPLLIVFLMLLLLPVLVYAAVNAWMPVRQRQA